MGTAFDMHRKRDGRVRSLTLLTFSFFLLYPPPDPPILNPTYGKDAYLKYVIIKNHSVILHKIFYGN